MLYTQFINEAIDLTIEKADNGLFYLEPLWRNILADNMLYFNEVSDYQVEPDVVEDVLQLEVEKRNTINSKKPDVINWLYDLITAQVEPAMLQEETEYIKQVTEFMKANHESKEQEEWEKFKKT